MSEILRCPVCSEKLNITPSGMACGNRHCFDRAKEGYVNLLRGNRPGSERGDSREMALSRRAFLNRGYYEPLADAVAGVLAENTAAGGHILDICCGEGYYTEKLCRCLPDRKYLGFDISREMVRLGAKRKCGADFFVANLGDIPLGDGSVDGAVHIFAPFNSSEFSRILKPDGCLLSVFPGRDHLMGLKRRLYEVPYPNDESGQETGDLVVKDRIRVKYEAELTSAEDIFALCSTDSQKRVGAQDIRMTPVII